MKTIMRKSIGAALIPLLIIALTSVTSCNYVQKSQDPNVLMIVIDDMGWGDIGYNSDDILSPNLDRLAENGIKFTHHYVNQECTPTRVSLMTGKFPNRYGLHCSSASNDQAFPFETVTLADAFKEQGYQTAISGKWHLGSLVEWGPLNYGFDHAYGSLAGAVGMYDHRYRLNREPYTRTWYRDDHYVDEAGHVYDLVTDNAIDLLENVFTRDKPFFLYLPYQGVHTPLVESEEWLEYNDHINNPSRQLFAAAVSHLDNQIGRVMESLERTGRRDNTLVVVFSDNGGFPDYSGNQYPPPDPKLTNFSSNGPLRGQKGQPYEGGIRVPAFVNWPGTLEPGVNDAVMHAVDWMPTLSKLIGYEPEADLGWDGQNIWPVITGDKKEFDEPRVLYWNYWNIRIALRWGDWKIISATEGAPYELYNLADDPYETTDLSESEPEKFDAMMNKLEEVRALDRKGVAPWLGESQQ
jgi:arylsulfatase A-like enzyme